MSTACEAVRVMGGAVRVKGNGGERVDLMVLEVTKYPRTHARTHTRTHTRTHAHMHTCAHTHTHTHTHIARRAKLTSPDFEKLRKMERSIMYQ